MAETIFTNRSHAGKMLAGKLQRFLDVENLLILALPRGGVPVAVEVAKALYAPMDVFVVRKLGVPGHEELAMGAVAQGGVRVLNTEVIDMLRIPDWAIDRVAAAETAELHRRGVVYRGDKPPLDPAGRNVIVIDDGLATGSTMKAALLALRSQRPKGLFVAVPVSARQTAEELRSMADQVICAATPEPFHAVGQWYQDFSQLTDDDVRRDMEHFFRADHAA